MKKTTSILFNFNWNTLTGDYANRCHHKYGRISSAFKATTWIVINDSDTLVFINFSRRLENFYPDKHVSYLDFVGQSVVLSEFPCETRIFFCSAPKTQWLLSKAQGFFSFLLLVVNSQFNLHFGFDHCSLQH